jgi:heme/copper-type cytochrome/quinol oxidase subunit 1
MQNLILLTSVFLFNLQLLLCAKTLAPLASQVSGWTIYPPLSALPKQNPDLSIFQSAFEILFYTQIFFLLVLVVVAILTGKNWKVKNEA